MSTLKRLRFFHQARHAPRLRARHRPAFGDLDEVALAELAGLHVRVVLLAAGDGLAHERIAHAAHLLELARVGELLGRELHAQAELGAQQRFQLLLQLRGFLAAQFARLHRQPPSIRCTTMVRKGSFAAASAKASLAVSSVMPSISKLILPGWLSVTHYSGSPLPLRMRTAAGFSQPGL